MTFGGLTEREFFSLLLKSYGNTDEYLISEDIINFELLKKNSDRGFFLIEKKGNDFLLLNIDFRNIYFYTQEIDNNINDIGIFEDELIIEIVDFILKENSLKDIKKLFLENKVINLLYKDKINKKILYDLFIFYNKSKFKSDNNILFNFIILFILKGNNNLKTKINKILFKKSFYIEGNNIKKIVKEKKIKYNPSDYITDSIDTVFVFLLTKLIFNNKKKPFTKNQKNTFDEMFKNNKSIFSGELGIRHLTLDDKYGEGYNSELLYNHREIYEYYEKAFSYGLIDELYIEIEDCSNESLLKNNDNPLCIKKYRVKKGSFDLYRDIINDDYKYNLFNFIFKKNIKNIKKYLEEYFNMWANNKLTHIEKNYLLIEIQLKKVIQEIDVLSKKYGTNDIKFDFIMKQKNESNEIDYLGCLLYLNYIGTIQITNLGYLFGERIIFNINDLNIINQSIFDNNKKIYFNGDVLTYKGNLIKVSGKQKDLIKSLIEKKGSITEYEATEIIYSGATNIPNFKSLISQVNKKLQKIKYEEKISQSNGNIILKI